MNIGKKLLLEAPTRGVANAISAYVKDALYKGRRYSYGSVRLQQPGELGQVQRDPIVEVVESIERVMPAVLKMAGMALGIYVGGYIVWGLVKNWLGGNTGGFSGAPAGCRCVRWECD